MNDVTQTRVASVLTAVIGIWLLLSPLFITTSGGALVSTLVVGGILLLAGVIELFWESTIPSWVSGLTAIWMAGSTALFGMGGLLFWDTIAAATATLLIAMWDGVEIGRVAQKHHTHA